MKWLLLLLTLISCQEKPVYPIRGDVVEAVYGLGVVESEDIFHARAAIVSSVKEFYVAEGQDVQKGQALFISDQGSVTRAPFAGRITDIPISIGENLFPQTTVLTLVNLDSLFLSVSLEQQGAMRIKTGLKAEISFEFFRNQKFTGEIITIYPRDDQFIAKVKIAQWPQGVLPGMTADVAFEVARKINTVLVPSNAIANGHLVIKRDGKKQKLAVKIGLVDQENAEVLSPELNVSDEIILP